MEGLTTMAKQTKAKTGKTEKTKVKVAKSDSSAAATGRWRVFVTTGEHADGGTDCTPYLIVYGEDGVTKPIPLLDKRQRFTPGSTCHFDVGLCTYFRLRVL